MQNLKTLLFAALLISGLASLASISNSVMAIPPTYLDAEYVFGPLSGLSENETGAIDWIIVGNWRSSLTNDTTVQNNQSSNVFNAAIEMIRPDGTARHTHTLTDFTILNISNPDGNSTLYNGTSTVSLQEGPALDIPTFILKSNDNSVFTIMMDADSVDNHFGELPIYGVSANPEFMKPADAVRSSNLSVH
ncbi:MAG: hypothetical protein L0H53_11080 [Candidatus Nitrosocosmicus sp.]|nr:hypothetical protein [Candidatus Nitrosocosmicus sp.]MDN5866434.1 hypothetical protein [Candidatus Nitrosocosmicus sp.]